MSWPKRLLINMAFDDLGLAGYVFDLTPDEIQACLLRLDSMMATWETMGIRIGYLMSSDPTAADPDQDSGIPDWANEAVYKNLAIRQASSFGKAIPMSLLAPAKQAYDGMVGLIAAYSTPQMQYRGNLPSGAGWKRSNANGGPFVLPPVDRLSTGPDGLLDINGEVPV